MGCSSHVDENGIPLLYYSEVVNMISSSPILLALQRGNKIPMFVDRKLVGVQSHSMTMAKINGGVVYFHSPQGS